MILVIAPPVLQAPQAPTIPAQLTLDEALRIFRARGLDLLLAEAAVAQAEGDVRGAGSVPGLQVGLTTGKAEGYAPQLPGQSARSYSATLSDGGAIGDVLSGRRGLRVRTAEAALKAARHGRQDALRTVGAQVKIQFVQAALATLNLDLSTQTRDGARRTFELVQKRYAAGAVSEVEVSRAEVAYLEMEQALETSHQAMASTRAGLAFLLGERGAVPVFAPVGTFDHPQTPADLAKATPESLLDLARAHRPDLAAAKALEERSTSALSLAKREWVPDTGWSLGVSQQGTGQDALQPRTWTFGLSVTLPPPDKVQGDTARARADLQVQTLLRQKAEAQVALDVAAGWAAFQGSHQRLVHMEDRLLDQAKKTSELVAFQYERGAASLLDVLDAQRTWIAIKGEYLQTLNDYWSGLFQLEQSVGKELK